MRQMGKPTQQVKSDDTCILCNGNDFQLLFEKPVSSEKFSVIKCINCGLLITSPQIKEEDFSKYYTDKYECYSSTGGKITNFLTENLVYRSQIRKFKHLIGNESNVLEIGCGTGSFIKYLSKSTGCKANGIEPGEKAAEFARSAGLDVKTCGFEDYSTDKKFDLIIFRHVLEHLHDPVRSLEKASRLLRNRKSRIFIILPNTKTPEVTFFNSDWFAWEVPVHLYHFNPKTIKDLAEKTGLNVENIGFTKLPNNIIKSFSIKLQKKHKNLAKCFGINNVFLILLFLPISIFNGLRGRSGRMSLILSRKKD